ncbi:immunoglobulin-like domain-containing protein [Cohnella hongkongensis]|uniref:Immunoglobulin-like domain-containing protein n=1 Tax=Cohnella hongkongensis TaxID=178337 RepID=A0ABV9FCZ6_9BACL
MNDWRLVNPNLCEKGMRAALIAALLWGMLYAAGIRTAHAAEVTVNDWDSLSGAFTSSASGTTIILGANITQPAGALAVPSATDLTLDLAGYTLSITSPGISAIRVDSGRALTIEDSSAGGAGTLIAKTNGFGHAGIGGEGGVIDSAAGTITINGGRIEAYGGPNAAGIGGNMGSSGGSIHINEGTIKATGGSGGAGIGGGYSSSGGTININGGTVTAAGGLMNSAGIGGGYGAAGGTITITDGTVHATGGIYGAGIGGGYGGDGGTITIHNGTVTAFSSNYGAGIGGGFGGDGGTITIYNGTVTATSNVFGAGIGGGFQGGGGTIAIHDGTVIPSTRATPSVSVIGPGHEGAEDSFSLVNGGTITIPEGYQLIIPEGVTVENSGTINGGGSIGGAGSIENTGTITVEVVGPEVGGTAFLLRFDLNGGTGSIPSITVYAATLQDAGATLPEPIREGYEFEGWYTQPDGGDEMTATYAISGDMDLFARWNAKEVTVVDWDSLLDAFANSTSGTTIILGADITQPAGALTVPSATNLTLDLAGHTLSITSGSNSAIRVNAGTSLTIEDSSAYGAGRLIAITTGSGYAGIGGGPDFGTIMINGGNVDARGANKAAGIGGGMVSAGGVIRISGGEVSATGGMDGAGIGGGPQGDGGTITIDGGAVSAAGGHGGAGIGGGGFSTGVTIHMNGGTVIANGGGNGAGIGGGYQGVGSTIHINGGTVTANGGVYSAGIGGGYQGAGGGTITITDGTVHATGGIYGAGIGGGYQGAGGTIAIHGGTVIPSSGANPDVSVIGPGQEAEDESFSLINGGTITLPAGHRLIVPEGVTVENSGTINGGGSIGGAGQIHNTGIIAVVVEGPEVNGVAFELRFDLNGGTGSIPSITVFAATLQEAGVTLPEPVREGYEFEGWHTQPDGGDEMTETYAISGDMDLFARWKDLTPPAVTLNGPADDPLNGAFEVTATFSEGVTGFSVEDIEVINGTAGSWNAANSWTYTFVVTPTTDGPVTIEISAGVAEDAAGNENTASLPLTRTYDGTAPDIVLDPPGSTEPAQSVQPEAAVTDASELAALQYAWTTNPAAPGTGDPEWQPFSSGDALTLATGDGDRYVHIYARDAAGNEQAVSFGPYVLDNTAPVIGLNGDSPLYLLAGQPYVEPGAWATDNIDGPIDSGEITVTGEVDAHRPGAYEVRYAVSDRAGNHGTVTRSVYVYDGDSPVIVLRGDNPMVVAVGSEFVDPGATAQDAQDGDVTAAITVTGSVYAHAAGTYTLSYNVSDSAGNAAPEAKRTVHVIAPPAMALIGPTEVTIPRGGSFSDPGATANDAYYGNLSDRIVVSGSVDTQTPGVYTLRYTVTNPIGQTAEATRTVTVRQPPSPGGVNGGGTRDDEDGAEETETGHTNAVNIVLNGLSVAVDSVQETTDDGRTVVRLRLTAEMIAALFGAPVDAVAEASGSGEVVALGRTATPLLSAALTKAVIAADGIGDVVVLELPAVALHGVRRIQPEAVLRLVVDGHGLLLPLNAVERVSADAVVEVTIGRASSADSDAAKRAIAALEAEALQAHPVIYTLAADGRPVGGWDGAYRERTMTLQAPADAHHSTAVWIDERGGLHFVPSVFEEGGRDVTLPTRQDGAYTVIRSNRTFRDLQEHWARDEIEQLANKRIVAGRETGAFAPSDPVTRAEFAALLVRGLGLPQREGTSTFSDVAAASWYAEAVGTASEAGLVHGYEDGTFRPQERITREQMAVMIARAIAYAGQATGGAGDEASFRRDAFADRAEIAEWAKEEVAQLAAAGIIQGLTTTEFAPQSDTSRAQSAVILKRMLLYLGFINP